MSLCVYKYEDRNVKSEKNANFTADYEEILILYTYKTWEKVSLRDRKI